MDTTSNIESIIEVCLSKVFEFIIRIRIIMTDKNADTQKIEHYISEELGLGEDDMLPKKCEK